MSWCRLIGGAGPDQFFAVAVTADGSAIYVAGSSTGSVIQGQTTNLDAITVRYNSDGSLNWIRFGYMKTVLFSDSKENLSFFSLFPLFCLLLIFYLFIQFSWFY